MSARTTSIVAGAAGALTTTLLHELTWRLAPDAPRVDLLGMQALAAGLRRAGVQPPAGQSLFTLTLTGDLVSNTAYFSVASVGPCDSAIPVGVALGAAAGLGAVYLPPSLNLSALPTRRTATTGALIVALYTAGGLVAGVMSRVLADQPVLFAIAPYSPSPHEGKGVGSRAEGGGVSEATGDGLAISDRGSIMCTIA